MRELYTTPSYKVLGKAFIAERDSVGRREEKCFFSRVYIYTRTLVERQVFNFYTDDASIAVTSPLPVVYELPPRALPSDFLCHKLPRARRACNINKFSAEIRPRCAISARSAGDRRNGVGDGRVRLLRREREREGSVKQRHSGKVGRRYRAKHPEAG